MSIVQEILTWKAWTDAPLRTPQLGARTHQHQLSDFNSSSEMTICVAFRGKRHSPKRVPQRAQLFMSSYDWPLFVAMRALLALSAGVANVYD